MSLTSVERSILRVAVDDWWGLWEVAPAMRSYLPEPYRVDQPFARRAVEGLIEKGMLSVYLRNGPVGTPILIEPPMATGLVRDPASWEVPKPGDTQTLIAATDAGASAYYDRDP